jgi:hypothetical protein
LAQKKRLGSVETVCEIEVLASFGLGIVALLVWICSMPEDQAGLSDSNVSGKHHRGSVRIDRASIRIDRAVPGSHALSCAAIIAAVGRS